MYLWIKKSMGLDIGILLFVYEYCSQRLPLHQAVNSPQSCSSSPSEHSGKPLHLRCSLIHDWSVHINMPSGHCVWHISAPSSSPSWQSASPSQSQSLLIQEMPPRHGYSSERQVMLGQSWNYWCYWKVLQANTLQANISQQLSACVWRIVYMYWCRG